MIELFLLLRSIGSKFILICVIALTMAACGSDLEGDNPEGAGGGVNDGAVSGGSKPEGAAPDEADDNPDIVADNAEETEDDDVIDDVVEVIVTPKLLDTAPFDTQVGVFLNSVITFTFDSADAFEILSLVENWESVINEIIPGSLTWDENEMTATYTPDSNLVSSTTYEISLPEIVDTDQSIFFPSLQLKFTTRDLLALTIVDQPAGVTTYLNDDVNFTVSAFGQGLLIYQWFKDGSPLSGATSANLFISGLDADDAGKYSVVVADSFSSMASLSATLTVYGVPVIGSHPSSESITEGDTTTFTIEASGEGSLVYQWMRDSGPVIGATSSSLTVSNASVSDAGSYYCRVGNEAGVINTNNAELVVSPLVIEYDLDVALVGEGSIQSLSTGIDCGVDCDETYEESSEIILLATASDGYEFAGWIGACTGTGSCDITMSEDRSVTALFSEVVNTLEDITLTWVEPGFNDDGSELPRSEIESYEILWGASEDDMSFLVTIEDPTDSEYIVKNLDEGVYYFSISVRTIYGSNSNQSNVIRRVVN